MVRPASMKKRERIYYPYISQRHRPRRLRPGYESYLSGFPRNGQVWEGFSQEKVTGLEVAQDGVARNSEDLNETREESDLCHEDDFGAGRSSRAYGSVSLLKCLNRIGEQLNTTKPAACASGVSNAGDLPHASPRQFFFGNAMTINV